MRAKTEKRTATAPLELAKRADGMCESSNRQTSPYINNLAVLKNFRRQLRTFGTSAEGYLWNILKAKQVGGLQFRRQFSIGHYILDFYCPAIRLAIELDGEYHYHGEQPEADYMRDDYLRQTHGIETLRLENKVVFDDPECVIEQILRRAEEVRLQKACDSHTPPAFGHPL